MARINVEDDLLKHPRFQALVVRMGGDMERAIGRLVRFWWAAQREWKDNRASIPKEEFTLGSFEHVLEVGFAVEREDGIVARAASSQFDWLLGKAEAGAAGGKQSAKARLAKYGTAVPNGARNAPKQHFESASNKTEATFEAPTEAPTEAHRSSPNPPTLTPSLEQTETSSLSPPRADLALIWSKHRGSLPAISRMTTKRQVKAAARLKEEPHAEYWMTVVDRMARSSFLTGTNDRSWKADFDWLIANSDNHVKVSEGKYNDKKAPTSSTRMLTEEDLDGL